MVAIAESPRSLVHPAGQTLVGGEYELMGVIGRGATASVYRAHSRSLGRDVAVKVLSASFADDPAYRAWFLAEGARLAGFRHPNLVEVFDCGEDAGTVYAAMGLASRGNVRQRATWEGGTLPPLAVARIVSGVASALDYMHRQGALHLDVKPGNILLADADWPWLADFGIPHNQDRPVGGTPAYMAPEQRRGDALNGRADQYALAATARELLTGLPPDSASAALPPMVQTVIARAMSVDREARYPTVAAFSQALLRAIDSRSLELDNAGEDLAQAAIDALPGSASSGAASSPNLAPEAGHASFHPGSERIPGGTGTQAGGTRRPTRNHGWKGGLGLRLAVELWLAEAFVVALAHALGLPPAIGWLVQIALGAASLACLQKLGPLPTRPRSTIQRASIWLALVFGLMLVPVLNLAPAVIRGMPSLAWLASAATAAWVALFVASSGRPIGAACDVLAGELVRQAAADSGLRLGTADVRAWRQRTASLAALAAAGMAVMALCWILQPALYQALPETDARLAALTIICLGAVGFLPRVTGPSQWFAPYVAAAIGSVADQHLFGAHLPASHAALVRRTKAAGAVGLACLDAGLLLGLTFLLPPALSFLWPADTQAFWWAGTAFAGGLLTVPALRLRRQLAGL